MDWYKNRFERRGCTPKPCHLLSGLGLYAFLFSPAKVTQCNNSTFLPFPIPMPLGTMTLARLAGLLNVPQELYKTGNLLEFEQAFVVRVTPQGDLVGAAACNYPFCPKVHHYKHDAWFSHGVSCLTARSTLAFSSLSRLMYSPLIL